MKSSKPNASPSIFNSLRIRLILSALLLIVLLLPSIGIALNNAFKQQVLSNTQDQLSAYLYSVLAVTEMEQGELFMPERLLENQFNVIGSGLYALISKQVLPQPQNNDISTPNISGLTSTQQHQNAQITPVTPTVQPSMVSTTQILWSSNSFLGQPLPTTLPHPNVGKGSFSEINLDGEPYLIYSFSVRFAPSSTTSNDELTAASNQLQAITVHIIKDFASISEQQQAFSQHLWSWLFILMLVVVAIQLAWLGWTLKPLARFKQELQAVQQGNSYQLTGQYPTELQAVAKQLNTLLSTEQHQRSRYRNALSDLAHSLKTPLAVIQSQKELSPTSIEQISHINRTISHQLKRAQSAAGNAWHLGIKVLEVSDKLLRTLSKIHPTIDIKYAKSPEPNCIFYGDQSDLTELLGNLLDNACKAATSQVRLSVVQQEATLRFIIEDDGKGISEQQRDAIFERGKRVDTYEQGHGIGLAIVRDLVDSYQGHLTISSSSHLGGACFEVSFNQAA